MTRGKLDFKLAARKKRRRRKPRFKVYSTGSARIATNQTEQLAAPALCVEKRRTPEPSIHEAEKEEKI